MSDRRRRVPRPVREQQIIDAAIRTFARRGYHAASVDEIAELAGITKPMVYLYLGSKEGLFTACLRREAERLVSALRAAAGGAGPPEARLRAGLSAFFAHVAAHRDGWVLLHRQVAAPSEAVAAELVLARRAVTHEVAGLVAAGAAASPRQVRLGQDDADFVALALVGAADSLTDWMERHPDQPPEQITQRLMTMVWVGMRNFLDGEVWTPPEHPAPPGPQESAAGPRASADRPAPSRTPDPPVRSRGQDRTARPRRPAGPRPSRDPRPPTEPHPSTEG